MFQKLTGEDGRDGKMPVNDKSCRLRIPLDQKIHVVDMYSDQGHSLMAVGLSSGLAIISLVLDEDDALSGYQVLSHLSSNKPLFFPNWLVTGHQFSWY